MKKLSSIWNTYRGMRYEFEHLIKGVNKGKFRTVVYLKTEGCTGIVSPNTKSHAKAKAFIDTYLLLS